MQHKPSLYFAYGSNLSSKALKKRCPGAEFLDIGVLRDYEVVFNFQSSTWSGGGAAGIEHRPGSQTWGVLYSLSANDWLLLNQFEGVSTGAYGRINLKIKTLSGTVEAVSYEVIRKLDNELRPTPAYAKLILDGAAEHGLPEWYIDSLKIKISRLRYFR